jgi:deazaflavin-dependent oxidoreductase (nitroreductase family)
MDEEAVQKRKRVRVLQRYLLNPPVKVVTWLGVFPGHVLIETKGRRSGKRRRNVVGLLVDGNTGWIVAEQGRHAGYVHNLQADPQVRVRIARHWRDARAEIADDDDPEARLESFSQRSHVAAVRRFGTELTSIRLDFSPDRG